MAKQTGINPHVSVLNVWHDWFKGDGDAKPGEASGKEIHDILAGRRNLPPNCRIRLNVDSVPRDIKDKDADLVAQWPTWRFILREKGSGKVVAEDVLNSSETHGAFMSIQAPDRPEGVYQDSRGYAPIFIYEPHVDGPLTLDISCEFEEKGWVATESLPWAAGK